jgi:aspartyl-tRNA(Asn)/glutamyl-tRNA(Gln) amidotransferase subunit C
LEKITREQIKKVAYLARIKIENNEEEMYLDNLNEIFQEIQKLEKIDTTGIKPVSSVIKQETKFRQDIINDGNKADLVVANTKYTKYNYFIVPKVVE